VPDDEVVQPLKRVIRIGTEHDAEIAEANKRKEKDAFAIALKKIAAHHLQMYLVDVEYTFDGSKIIFYFTAEGRIDFRELVRDLASVFRTRIEMRQIGVRDEAKLLGGIGPCGRVLCCTSFLGDFAPVSIRMAKDQNLSLNPSKISGLCGRLMCCLRYEQETYEAAKKDPTLAPGYVPVPVPGPEEPPVDDWAEERPEPALVGEDLAPSGGRARIAQASSGEKPAVRRDRPRSPQAAVASAGETAAARRPQQSGQRGPRAQGGGGGPAEAGRPKERRGPGKPADQPRQKQSQPRPPQASLERQEPRERPDHQEQPQQQERPAASTRSRRRRRRGHRVAVAAPGTGGTTNT
jgi:hypothetical protein